MVNLPETPAVCAGQTQDSLVTLQDADEGKRRIGDTPKSVDASKSDNNDNSVYSTNPLNKTAVRFRRL